MKYCGQCGNRLGSGRFCGHCGAQVRPAADEIASAGPSGPPPAARYPMYADGQAPGPTMPPPSVPPPSAPPSASDTMQAPAVVDGVDPGTSDDEGAEQTRAQTRDQTAERLPVVEETAVRPALRMVPDPETRPEVPSLAETAVHPAVPRVDIGPEPADDVQDEHESHTHSAWAQTLWLLLIFLMAIIAAGVWLLRQ
jgi:hypothetical protein